MDLLSDGVLSKIGCNVGRTFVNVPPYTDNYILTAPSRLRLRHILDVVVLQSKTTDVALNASKSVCRLMVFCPRDVFCISLFCIIKSCIFSSKFSAPSTRQWGIIYFQLKKSIAHILNLSTSWRRETLKAKVVWKHRNGFAWNHHSYK